MSWSRPLDAEFEPLFGKLGEDSPKAPVLTGKFNLVTPMIGGGAEAGKIDVDDPIRSSEIVGCFRECFRLACARSYSSPEDLRAGETILFGDSTSPGKVRIEIECRNIGEGDGAFNCTGRDRVLDIPNYVISILLQGGAEVLCLKPQYQLAINVYADVSPVEEAQLKMTWATFKLLGGVGARRSRGGGVLQLENGISEGQLQAFAKAQPCSYFRSVTGAKIFVLKNSVQKTSSLSYTKAWHIAMLAYQLLCRGIESEHAVRFFKDELNERKPEYWPDRDGPRLKEMSIEQRFPEDFQCYRNAVRHTRWAPDYFLSDDDEYQNERAQFGLPRKHGKDNGEINVKPKSGKKASEGRYQSPIFVRPLLTGGKILPSIIVLADAGLSNGDVVLVDDASQQISVWSEEIQERLGLDQHPKNLRELCSLYFTALGFEEVK